MPAPLGTATGTPGVPGAGGVTPDDEVDTDAGGRGGVGGRPADDELAGGTTTGGVG
ncbi:MAG: hypothetical protein PGN37_13315 [Mycobacterium kyogaense]|uniref:hypothetical protein n=1 Tax=Mycobacterium kyogaense TaxID=2212479 RepID=UPI002FF8586C